MVLYDQACFLFKAEFDILICYFILHIYFFAINKLNELMMYEWQDGLNKIYYITFVILSSLTTNISLTF